MEIKLVGGYKEILEYELQIAKKQGYKCDIGSWYIIETGEKDMHGNTKNWYFKYLYK